MTTSTKSPKTITGYRKAWTGGAKAYQEADTFEALAEGMKRKRSLQYIHMPTSLFAGEACTGCGTEIDAPYRLNPNEEKGSFEYGKMVDNSEWTLIIYRPKSKTISTPYHYYCGWGALMGKVEELGRRMGY